MKNIFLVLLFCTIAYSLAAQNPSWSWARQSSGGNYEDASSIDADATGNVFVTGFFANDTAFFGTDTMLCMGSADCFIIKYDEFGNMLWSQSIGGPGDEYGQSVSPDGSGGVIVGGNYSSVSVSFGSYILNNSSPGTPDVFVVHYDSNGNVVWAETFGGNNWDNLGGVEFDPATNNTYFTGAYYLGEMIIGSDTLPNNGNYDMFVGKLDMNGNPLWAKSAGGNFNDLGNAITIDGNNGHVYVTGGFASDTLSFPTDTLVNAFGSMPDMFTVRYDNNGNCIWAKREGNIDNDHTVAIAVDQFGGLYVAGHYHSTDMVIGGDTMMNMGMGDVFLIKYDTAGAVQWWTSFGGMDNDFAYGVDATASGEIVITGMFSSSMMQVGSTTLVNASADEDIFIVGYYPGGSLGIIWSEGGTGRDYINSIAFGPSYEMYVAGSFGSQTLTCGSDVLTNADPGGTGEALIGRLDVSVNVEEQLNHSAFIAFPNPVAEKFYLMCNTTIESVVIYNSLGEQVEFQQAVNSENYSLDLTGQPAGIYLYSFITMNGETISGRFVKL